jgi:hypothetical protein
VKYNCEFLLETGVRWKGNSISTPFLVEDLRSNVPTGLLLNLSNQPNVLVGRKTKSIRGLAPALAGLFTLLVTIGGKALSSKLFQKISFRALFFIFGGKGFESQWLCQNVSAQHLLRRSFRKPDSLKIR